MKKIVLVLISAALLLPLAACSGGEDRPAIVTHDHAAEAAALVSEIASISGATIENEKKIDDAYLAYWSLPEEYCADVTNFDRLEELRSELTKQYIVKQYKDTRIPHERILIGGYGWRYASDEEVQAFVDSYFDFMWNCSAEILQKFGLGCFSYAGFLGIPVDKNMSEEDFRAAVEGKNFDHENLWCVDFIDEPSQKDIPKYWNTAKIISEEILPQCGFIMNLVPLYAYGDDVGVYEKLLNAYFDTVGSVNDIVSFDHYIYAPQNAHHQMKFGTPLISMLTNFDMLADRCIEKGHDLYAILQNVDAWITDSNDEKYYEVSADMMKFQAYFALAYGAKAIVWFETGYPAGTPVDENGSRNEAFDKLEEVNGDIKAIEPVYMRYSNDSHAVISGNLSSKVKSQLSFYSGNKSADDLKQTAVTGLSVVGKGSVLTGHFKKNVGDGDAFMFAPLSDSDFSESKVQTITVSFSTADDEAVVTAYRKGIPTVLTPVDGVYTVEIRNADGVFVTVD